MNSPPVQGPGSPVWILWEDSAAEKPGGVECGSSLTHTGPVTPLGQGSKAALHTVAFV